MKKLILILAIIFSPTASLAAIEGLDAKQPIAIDADALEVLQKEQKAIFSGNVVAKQGDMNLNADEMVVFYKPGGGDDSISKIEVVGNVRLSTKAETAKAQSGVYDTSNSVVILNGDVTLTKDNNILKGNKLTFNIATGQSKLEKGEGTGGRVRGLFIPQ